jgi:hypothetical protein
MKQCDIHNINIQLTTDIKSCLKKIHLIFFIIFSKDTLVVLL